MTEPRTAGERGTDRRLDGILDGAIDLHRHGYPEVSDELRTPLSDEDDMTRCRDAGMAAVVLKSHTWPTMGRALLLERLVPGIRVVPSITLNPVAGGMNPEVIELAARQGAGVVFLPTAGAHNDVCRGGISRTIENHTDHFHPDAGRPITILDEDGRLTPQVRSCLDVIDEYSLSVYSGHLSPREVLALARDGGLADRLVFSHPDSHSIGADDEVVTEVARRGGYIEICALGAYPRIGRVTHGDLARLVRLVGAARCVMTSDYFFSWCPPSSQMLLDLAHGLAGAGITRDQLVRMLRTNPAAFLAAASGPTNQVDTHTEAATTL